MYELEEKIRNWYNATSHDMGKEEFDDLIKIIKTHLKTQTEATESGPSVGCGDLIMPAYGDRVTFDHYYYRTSKQTKRGKDNYYGTLKCWEVGLCDMQGIFLGTRTLQDGWLDWPCDEGCTFVPTRRYKVALVSPGPNKNPLYVPLTAI